MAQTDVRSASGIRVALALGLLTQLVGFIYDFSWHASHPQTVAIPPAKLIVVHGGIYLGGLIIAVAFFVALLRGTFAAGPARLVVAAGAIGAVVEFVGNGTDMWAHGHGYEKALYHGLIYAGAAVTILGYVSIEALRRSGRREQVPANR